VALTFLLDEHLRGVLMHAIQRHNSSGVDLIDAVCVGDPPDLPLGSSDPDIISWAEHHGRVLVTRDVHTMPANFFQHLRAGNLSPGLLFIRPKSLLADIVAELAMIANAGDAADYFDQMDFIP
jgi:hypothetical protein